MDALKERILADGKVLDGNILKVSSFLNHMIDAQLMSLIGIEFAQKFADQKPTKIITIETSGIAMAAFTAYELKIPFIIAKKHASALLNDDDCYSADIFSHTKQILNNVRIPRNFINPSDRLLIIDDFLAHGKAVLGLIDIIKEANATLLGVGICVEKSFQAGAKELNARGVNLHSLAKIKSLENGKVEFH